MDRNQEEMKFVGFFGIFGESFKTIFSWKKIFAQITLTLILPLTIIFLAHMEISRHFFPNIERNTADTYQLYNRRASSSDWLYYWLFKLGYFTVLTVFSLLSTAAIVFTIASLYTGRDVEYRKVMKVVPRVWKRVFVTFACIFLAFFIYDVIAGIALYISGAVIGGTVVGIILLFIVLIVYIFGFLYLSVVWQLASVVSVLETAYGFKAMVRGKNLVKGKKGVGMGIAFILYGLLVGIVFVYVIFIEYGGEIFDLAMVWRVVIGGACGFMLLSLFLLFFVSQTMLYLVCKSHHHEMIDKLSLSTYLGAYLEDPRLVPAPGEEIQLGRPHPQRPSQV